MSTIYILVWIVYAFYLMDKGRTKDEAIGGLIAGIFYGGIWPIMIPLHIYQELKTPKLKIEDYLSSSVDEVEVKDSTLNEVEANFVSFEEPKEEVEVNNYSYVTKNNKEKNQEAKVDLVISKPINQTVNVLDKFNDIDKQIESKKPTQDMVTCIGCLKNIHINDFLSTDNDKYVRCPLCSMISMLTTKQFDRYQLRNLEKDYLKLKINNKGFSLFENYSRLCLRFNELSAKERYQGVCVLDGFLRDAFRGRYRVKDVATLEAKELQEINRVLHPKSPTTLEALVGEIIWSTVQLWILDSPYANILVEYNWEALINSIDYSEMEYEENEELLRLCLNVNDALD